MGLGLGLRAKTERFLGSGLRKHLRWFAVEATIALIEIPVWLVARALPRKPITQPQRILVIRLDLLGDVALTLPAIRSLRIAYPDTRIDMLVRPSASAVAALCPDIDHVLSYDIEALRPSGRPLHAASWRDAFQIVRTLRAERYDLVIGVFGKWASLLAVASGAPSRVGFRREGFRGAYSMPVSGRRYKPVHHEREYGLRLARAAGGAKVDSHPYLVVGEAERQDALQLLSKTKGDGPLLVVSAASSAADAKRWTVDGWVGFINDAMNRGYRVAMVGGPGEEGLVDSIASRTERRPLVLAGKTSLEQLVAVLAVADLVVAGDTGPLHIAEALGTPVVGIYGPSNPAISGPTRRHSTDVRTSIECSPCYDATFAAVCPLGHHKCMVDLPSSMVSAALQRTVRSI